MHRPFIRTLSVLAVAALLGGCEDALLVTNPNSGDSEKVLSTPQDVENLLGGYYKRWHASLFASTNDVQGMASNMSFMNYSSLANSCFNNHTPFTGATNFNSPGNTCSGEQLRLFQINSEVNKVASTILARLDGGMNLGSPAANLRARAFAELLNALSIGYTAIFYDSLGVVSAGTAPDGVPPLVDYIEARDSTLAAFNRSLAASGDALASGVGGFPLPATWIPSPSSMTATYFTQLTRSYRARILASMARTPAERADVGAGGIVDWAMVIADAAAGVTANFQITTNTISGPTHGGWRNTFAVPGLWHQMPPFWIGMADNSGSYAAWIATPMGDRGAGNQGFFMTTTDLRFPQGATRAAQQADFAVTSCSGPSQTCLRYFANRPAGSDQYAGSGFGWSNYDFERHRSWNTSGAGTARNGPTTDIPLQELNLLRAEGLYRQGSYAAAATLVNLSRTVAGLPNAPTDAVTLVSGGVNCVPKVPVAPFNVVACGNLWETLKYEKRIETMYMSYAPTFIDARGWGDLPKDTPLYWATPFQELQARKVPTSKIYGVGIGAGNAPFSFAAVSGYGW